MTTLNILYHGLHCVSINAKSANGEVSLVCDPYETKGVGLRLPRTLSGEILLISSNSDLHNSAESVAKPELVVREPGEYEKSGIFIYGIPTEDNKMIFRIEFDDLTVAHLGGLTKSLGSEEMSQLENVDILFLPVGGGDSLDYKTAVDVANQLEPRIIIPINYDLPGLSISLDKIDKFLKEYGAKHETINKLKVAYKDLPPEDTKVMVLESLNNQKMRGNKKIYMWTSVALVGITFGVIWIAYIKYTISSSMESLSATGGKDKTVQDFTNGLLNRLLNLKIYLMIMKNNYPLPLRIKRQ